MFATGLKVRRIFGASCTHGLTASNGALKAAMMAPASMEQHVARVAVEAEAAAQGVDEVVQEVQVGMEAPPGQPGVTRYTE